MREYLQRLTRRSGRALAAFVGSVALAIVAFLVAQGVGLQTLGSAALAVFILLGTLLLVREHRALVRKSELFDITLKNMSQGLCMYDDMQRLVWRVYPYIAAELFLRWSEQELSGVVLNVLICLEQHGLIESNAERTEWHRPPPATGGRARHPDRQNRNRSQNPQHP